MEPRIRPEADGDAGAIREVVISAFPTGAEADLVERLRNAGALAVSLVAELDGRIVGHIAFSEVTLRAPGAAPRLGLGLAPVAVRPSVQQRGIGGALVREGLRRAPTGYPFCVVLGHPEYYPRFGFSRASLHELAWEHPCRDEAFMVTELVPGGLRGLRGVVAYRPEFDAV